VEELEARRVPALPRPAHVVIVVEENRSFNEIIGSPSAPYINSLASQGALLTNSFAVEHPSQPNYLDLFSGSNQAVTDDSTPHTFAGPDLGGELTAAGITFASFSESLPRAGFTGSTTRTGYARKHNPAVDFTDVPAADNLPFPVRRKGRRSSNLFTSNFAALPTVSLVVPNLNHDMHDGPVRAGDRWLQANLGRYVQWAQSNNSLLILTWDEDDGTAGNHVATLIVGQGVQPGQYPEQVNHFNVLRTVEDTYGLPAAGASGSATPITDTWATGG
jgi:acid phosphatase